MPKAVLTLDGKRFVVLPEREYERLKARSAATQAGGTRTAKGRPVGKSASKQMRRGGRSVDADAGDVAESRRRLADSGRVDAADLFRRLGV